jgi:hypothetical protein
MQKNPEGILCKHIEKKGRLECPYTYLSIAIAIRVRTLAVTVQMDIHPLQFLMLRNWSDIVTRNQTMEEHIFWMPWWQQFLFITAFAILIVLAAVILHLVVYRNLITLKKNELYIINTGKP